MRLSVWGIAVAGFVLASMAPAKADVETGVRKYNLGDYQGAIAEWLPLAANNDPAALYNLGQVYRLGHGVTVNEKQAIAYYERAARFGHVGAMSNLGSLYYFGDDAVRNRAAALLWWQTAAQAGEPRARYMLGILYFNGEQVAQDRPRALALTTLAANDGLTAARDSLDTMRNRLSAEEIRKGEALVSQINKSPQAPTVTLAALNRSHASVAEENTADLPAVAPAAPSAPARSQPMPASAPVVRKPVLAALAQPSTVASVQPVSNRPAAGEVWRIQLGAFSTRDRAAAAWTTLRGAHAGLLRAQQPAYLDAGGMTKLQLGGFAQRQAASDLCSRLTANGIACFVAQRP